MNLYAAFKSSINDIIKKVNKKMQKLKYAVTIILIIGVAFVVAYGAYIARIV